MLLKLGIALSSQPEMVVMPNWLVVMRHNLNNDELGGTTGVWEGDAVVRSWVVQG